MPVFANVRAAPVSDPDEIRTLLVEQVTGRVRWRETAVNMAAAGVRETVEFGGKVLSPMIARSTEGVTTTSIVTEEDMAAFAASI